MVYNQNVWGCVYIHIEDGGQREERWQQQNAHQYCSNYDTLKKYKREPAILLFAVERCPWHTL